jgi:hypothetical protein
MQILNQPLAVKAKNPDILYSTVRPLAVTVRADRLSKERK